MEGATQKLNMIFVMPPTFLKEGTIYYIHDLLAVIQPALDKYVNQPITMVSSMDEYWALEEDKRYSFDMVAVQMGSIAPDVLEDQVKQSKKLQWVHSVSAGLDGYLSK